MKTVSELQNQFENDIHGACRKSIGTLEIRIGVKPAIDKGVTVNQKKWLGFQAEPLA